MNLEFKTQEYNGVVSEVAFFPAKLVSLNDTIQELENENKTPFRIATIQFANANGELINRTALAFETSIQNAFERNDPPTVGREYSCQVVLNDDQPPLLKILFGGSIGERATMDDFGLTNTSARTANAEKVNREEEIPQI